MERWLLRGLLVLLMVGLAGCASGPTPTAAAVPKEGAVGGGGGAALGAEERQAAAVCVAALAERLGLAEAQIEVAALEATNWADTSLGCPEPGTMYAQVITPGYRVVLRAGGESYEYHTDGERAVTCPGP
ncbi:MAG: hypothetical protein GX605_08825 [Chloroflexi bacterium]|nr:hypothetical protein [Chloroflexota bacterium]